MNWAIVRRALLDGKGMLIGISIGMALFSAMTMLFYPTFKEQGDLMMKVVPSFVRKMMGSRAPFNSIEGFSSWEYTHPLAFAMCVAWSVAFGARAIAGGIDRGTLGLVLSAPVSRSRYYVSCVVALLIGQIIVLVATNFGFAISFYALGLPPRAGLAGFALTAIQGFLVFGAFGAVVLMASAAASDPGGPTMLGVGAVAISAFITLFGGVIEPLRKVEWLSLFFYYHPYEALRGLYVPWWHYIVPLSVLLGALVVGWQVFTRRDLSI